MVADPKSESRLPLLSLNIYVPRDEGFRHLKFSDFLADGLKSLVQILLPEIKSLFDDTINEFDNFEDVLNLYQGGIELPKGLRLGKTRSRLPWEMLRELVRNDGEQFLKFPIPDVIKRMLLVPDISLGLELAGRKYYGFNLANVDIVLDNTTAWRTDEEFAREMLAGVNPVVISRLQVVSKIILIYKFFTI